MSRFLGEKPEPVAAPSKSDNRFKSEVWENNFLFDYIKQSYLIAAQNIQSTVAQVQGLDPQTARKTQFFTRQFVDALAPTNFLFTNPAALNATVESGGRNLIDGLHNLLEDLEALFRQYSATGTGAGAGICTTPRKRHPTVSSPVRSLLGRSCAATPTCCSTRVCTARSRPRPWTSHGTPICASAWWIGESKPIQVDVRIVAATVKDLVKEVNEGRFRDDLFYRLHVLPIHIPPLRERSQDVPLLTAHFINKYSEVMSKNVVGIDSRSLEALMNYKWYGNVRELENTIERAIVLADRENIEIENLPLEIQNFKEEIPLEPLRKKSTPLRSHPDS